MDHPVYMPIYEINVFENIFVSLSLQ